MSHVKRGHVTDGAVGRGEALYPKVPIGQGALGDGVPHKIEMFLEEKFECSEQAKYQINYNRMAQTQTQMNSSMTLSANPLVEKCLTKMANDVTEQVRDKLIDIIIAVLGRECDDFDGEAVRRLIVTELEMTPVTFTLEKRGAAVKESKPKTLKVRAPKELKEPKEKAPKAPKRVLSEEEREARKAAKEAEKEAEKEARKAAKEAEKEAAKAAKQAERAAAKEANKDVDKEAAKAAKLAEKEAEKAAKLAEREAAKAARKAEKDAEREAAKAAKQAEKEAAAPAAAKEQRLPIPWCGKRIDGRCEAVRVYHGLFAQCTSDATEISAFCPSCEKSGAKFGTCGMRAACGLFDYTDPSGKKCLRLANIVDKFGVEGGLEAFIAEAAKHDISLPAEHLEKEVKQRGRPKSTSPRASKVATTDSGSETETDDEEHQQKRKQVTKVASAAEAPKKRGRPAKNPKSDVTPSDEVIQDLVASAAAMSVSSAPSTPVATANKPSAETPAAPKKAKAVTLRKPAQRKTRTIDEQVFWVDTFNGAEILIRQEDNATFEASNGEPLGFWDDATKTITACDDDEDEE